jgi:hypothetical protein
VMVCVALIATFAVWIARAVRRRYIRSSAPR